MAVKGRAGGAMPDWLKQSQWHGEHPQIKKGVKDAEKVLKENNTKNLKSQKPNSYLY